MNNKKCLSPAKLILDTILKDIKLFQLIFGILKLELGFLQSKLLKNFFNNATYIKIGYFCLKIFWSQFKKQILNIHWIFIIQTLKIIKNNL